VDLIVAIFIDYEEVAFDGSKARLTLKKRQHQRDSQKLTAFGRFFITIWLVLSSPACHKISNNQNGNSKKPRET